jgi:L-asparaginase II
LEPIRVVVRRGGVVEAVHRYHAVSVQDGKLLRAVGDPELVTLLRSAAKPFQALELVRAREDLTETDVAIASASHRAEPAQIEAVRALLEKAGATEDDLECGDQEGRPPGRIYHNCSGKHAGMLAACAARGWPLEGYRLPEHPLERAHHANVAAAAELEEADLPTAVDGCGVVTWGMTLERAARMFSNLERSREGRGIAAVMRAHPHLIGGEGSVDTQLMQLEPSFAAKGGAEGLLCIAGPAGVGVAIKAEDGTFRGLRPALAAFLEPLGFELSGFARVPVRNSRGENVGEIVRS